MVVQDMASDMDAQDNASVSVHGSPAWGAVLDMDVEDNEQQQVICVSYCMVLLHPILIVSHTVLHCSYHSIEYNAHYYTAANVLDTIL
jgi:hypothetical protein